VVRRHRLCRTPDFDHVFELLPRKAPILSETVDQFPSETETRIQWDHIHTVPRAHSHGLLEALHNNDIVFCSYCVRSTTLGMETYGRCHILLHEMVSSRRVVMPRI
jgi:hypothetical protein